MFIVGTRYCNTFNLYNKTVNKTYSTDSQVTWSFVTDYDWIILRGAWFKISTGIVRNCLGLLIIDLISFCIISNESVMLLNYLEKNYQGVKQNLFLD